jgi:hypothetical protein
MWQEINGVVEAAPIDPELALRGHLMEPVLLARWRMSHGNPWFQTQVNRKLPAQYGIDGAFCTIDALSKVDDSLVIVEIKTAQHRDEWGEPGTSEVPDHVAAQVMFQWLCVPNAVRAYVIVEFANFDYKEYVIERSEIADAMETMALKLREFWDSLCLGEAPNLDAHPATIATLRKQHPEIAKGVTAIVPVATGVEYKAASQALAAAELRMNAVKAQLLSAAGTAQFIEDEVGTKVAYRRLYGKAIGLKAA